MQTRVAVMVVAGVVVGTFAVVVTPEGPVTIATGIARVAVERAMADAARAARIAGSIEAVGEVVS